MLSNRRMNPKMVAGWGLYIASRVMAWALVVYAFYAIFDTPWLRIPYIPLSTIGIAVAFYAGFKNNAAYDRFWEARKIWGGVVNESRSWANAVLAYVLPGDTSEEAHGVRRELIYRHLAWINSLRIQLRSTSRFHHKPARGTKRRLERHAEHMRNDWAKDVAPFVDADELEALSNTANAATHIVANQGQALAQLHQNEGLDLFHQIELMAILRELYTLQGKAERIKKTPLPRQYAEFSRLFTRVFIYCVPFGLLDVFDSTLPMRLPVGAEWAWVAIYLISAGLIGWVFQTMEGVGDSSEDPFERSMNDVPMNALCIVIERDLRQLLGETEIPEPEPAIDGVLY